MPYIIGYLLEIVSVFGLKGIISPFTNWIIGYVLLFVVLKGKDPLNPCYWLFIGVNILIINGFSGILYVPADIQPYKIIVYVLLTVFAFHLGYGNVKAYKKSRKYNNLSVLPTWIIKINTICGLVGIIGSLLICVEMFVLFGVSIDDGGERRAQFQNLFPFLVLTPIGTILLGGSFVSIFSIFSGGSKLNKLLGLLNVFALATASMAIAGKQGIMFVLLILSYIFLFQRYYKIKFQIPKYVRMSLIGIGYLFMVYLMFLTTGRQNTSYEGELFQEGRFSQDFSTVSQEYLPSGIQNTVAEFFSYYGNQFPYVAERWKIEHFEDKYGYIRLPRILGLFTFIERQVIKVVPLYNDIYPDDREVTIKNQSKGYFGNANWGTIAFLNIKYFGIVGGLIFFLIYGKISRHIYDYMAKNFNYLTFQLNFINCAGMFYFTMFYITQETGPLIHFLILIFLLWYARKHKLSI